MKGCPVHLIQLGLAALSEADCSVGRRQALVAYILICNDVCHLLLYIYRPLLGLVFDHNGGRGCHPLPQSHSRLGIS